MPEITFNKKYMLAPTQYVVEERFPNKIALHYTAGYSAESAIAWWNKTPERVATPFVIDLDATVYQCHDPKHYAWHLGLGSHPIEMATLGIEIVNLGFLTKRGDKLFDDYKKPFCSLDEKDKYYEVPNALWRQQKYFARYSSKQIEAVAQTVRQMCAQFDIRKELLSPPNIEAFCPNLIPTFRGIFSHQNVINWKLDVGPAFPWGQFLSLVQAK